MAPAPVFITHFEILRSQDYVLITLGSPSGKITEAGQLQTEAVQQLVLTIPRFLELAATLSQMADNIRAPAAGARAEPQPAGKSQEAGGRTNDEPDAGVKGPADWVVRH